MPAAPPPPPPLVAPDGPPFRAPIPYASAWDDLVRELPGDCPAEPTLTMACLGQQGSWGNAVLQYAFLRAFAHAHGFACQTPRWIGSALLRDAGQPMSFRAPVVVADGFSTHCAVFDRLAPFDRDLLRARHLAAVDGRRYLLLREPALAAEGALAWPFRHADLEGFFFAHGRELAHHRELVRSLFRPLPAIAERAAVALSRLRRAGGTLVGIHVRRSDFMTSGLEQGFELITPAATYLRWLEGIWPSLDAPRLVVCTDSPREVLPAFARYSPVTAADCGFDLGELLDPDAHAWSRADRGVARAPGFFPDWVLLTRCDLLALSNSTFAFSAALMNERARLFVRPTLPVGELEPFDPWDSEPLRFLPATRSLPALAAQRMRLTARGLRGLPSRYWWRSGLRILGGYPRTLAWRAYTCHRVHGARRLARELLSPGFYWRAERRYMSCGKELSGADPDC